jgi:hypothetical protein
MRAASLLCVLLLVPLAIACGSDEAGVRAPAVASEGVDLDRPVRVARGRGLTVQLPGGWSRAHESLTPSLSDPREVLSVGTAPLRYRATGCAHVAGAALEDLGPADAFVTLQERGLDPSSTWPDFPERPARFGPELGGRSEASECAPSARFTDHWFTFSDRGRHFHVLVAFGTHAPPAVRDQAWGILDSLRVDPGVPPDWRSSG